LKVRTTVTTQNFKKNAPKISKTCIKSPGAPFQTTLLTIHQKAQRN
jgi:hypothetical protein